MTTEQAQFDRSLDLVDAELARVDSKLDDDGTAIFTVRDHYDQIELHWAGMHRERFQQHRRYSSWIICVQLIACLGATWLATTISSWFTPLCFAFGWAFGGEIACYRGYVKALAELAPTPARAILRDPTR